MRPALMLALWLVGWLALVVFLPGCVRSQVESPRATITAGALTITQTGSALSPASAASKTRTASVTLPAGSALEIKDNGGVSATIPAPALLVIESREDSATGPAAFHPPGPPSPVEEAAGIAARWCWAMMLGGVILAGLGIYWRGPLVIAGGVIVAGAGAFGLFIAANPWILTVGGVGVILAASGFALWHLWLKHRQGPARRPPSLPVA